MKPRVTDDERREVAGKLRERTKKPMGKSMQRMFTETLGMYTHNVCWMNPDKATNRWDVIVNYLADLVDRPTCQNKQIVYNRTAPKEFRTDNLICSACGEIFCADGDGVNHPIDWAFCPNCGAEVVEQIRRHCRRCRKWSRK